MFTYKANCIHLVPFSTLFIYLLYLFVSLFIVFIVTFIVVPLLALNVYLYIVTNMYIKLQIDGVCQENTWLRISIRFFAGTDKIIFIYVDIYEHAACSTD